MTTAPREIAQRVLAFHSHPQADEGLVIMARALMEIDKVITGSTGSFDAVIVSRIAAILDGTQETRT